MLETWKEVKDTDGQYLVSNFGKVLSKGNDKNRKDKVLKTYSYSKTGHQKVDLRVKGVVLKKAVHRLVAEAFLDNPLGYTVVNHKDNNPKNNTVSNLEWCTPAQNRLHYYAQYHLYKNPKFCSFVVKVDEPIQEIITKFCESLGMTRAELKNIL